MPVHSCGHSGCSKVFSKLSLLQEHENTHLGIRPYKCSLCDKSYYKQSHLMVHQSSIHSDSKYSCSRCNKCLSTEYSLRRHENICGRELKCYFCHKEFSRVKWYLVHLKSHSIRPKPSSRLPKGHTCTICGISYRLKKNLDAHVNNKHTNTTKYKCSICNREYSYKGSLTRHQNTSRECNQVTRETS
ncbi:hypothetical protein NEOKW01_1928 [Nematocida sp. AWRm80]|nr:hypothetical protein NEOKW01_1928 [Nematocida sp. AWRm80]